MWEILQSDVPFWLVGLHIISVTSWELRMALRVRKLEEKPSTAFVCLDCGKTIP